MVRKASPGAFPPSTCCVQDRWPALLDVRIIVIRSQTLVRQRRRSAKRWNRCHPNEADQGAAPLRRPKLVGRRGRDFLKKRRGSPPGRAAQHRRTRAFRPCGIYSPFKWITLSSRDFSVIGIPSGRRRHSRLNQSKVIRETTPQQDGVRHPSFKIYYNCIPILPDGNKKGMEAAI